MVRDFQVLRKAAQEQKEILELNRVGIDRDMMERVESTAKYVGVSMPKLFKEDKDK